MVRLSPQVRQVRGHDRPEHLDGHVGLSRRVVSGTGVAREPVPDLAQGVERAKPGQRVVAHAALSSPGMSKRSV